MHKRDGTLLGRTTNGRKRLVYGRAVLAVLLAAGFIAANAFAWLPWPHLWWTSEFEDEYDGFEHGWPLTYMRTGLYRGEFRGFGEKVPMPWPFSNPCVRSFRPTALAADIVVAACAISLTVLLCDCSNQGRGFRFAFSLRSSLALIFVLCVGLALLVPGIRILGLRDVDEELLLLISVILPLFVVPKYVVFLCCAAPLIYVIQKGLTSVRKKNSEIDRKPTTPDQRTGSE
jgi:hypothetical protein